MEYRVRKIAQSFNNNQTFKTLMLMIVILSNSTSQILCVSVLKLLYSKYATLSDNSCPLHLIQVLSDGDIPF